MNGTELAAAPPVPSPSNLPPPSPRPPSSAQSLPPPLPPSATLADHSSQPSASVLTSVPIPAAPPTGSAESANESVGPITAPSQLLLSLDVSSSSPSSSSLFTLSPLPTAALSDPQQRLSFVLSSLRGVLMQLQLAESPVADMAAVRQQLADIVQLAQQSEDGATLTPSPTASPSTLASPTALSTLSSSIYRSSSSSLSSSTHFSSLTSPHSTTASTPLSTPSSAAISAQPSVSLPSLSTSLTPSSTTHSGSPSPSSSSTIPFPSPLATTHSSAASSFDYSSASDNDTILQSPTASSLSSSGVASGSPSSSHSLLQNISKSPLKVLYVKVQQQYTVTRRQAKRMTQDEREKLVPVPVRIMGSVQSTSHTAAAATSELDPYASLYLVARDVCQLIHLRQGSVSKVIHDFLPSERSRIPILCQRSTGAGCTQVLTVLTMEGVRRLLSNSQSPLAPHVLKWITEQVELVVKEGAKGRASSGPTGVDGRALKQLLKGSGMVLEGEKRKERKRERASTTGQQELQHQQGRMDKGGSGSSGTDKKARTDGSSPAGSGTERVSSAFIDFTAAGSSTAPLTPRHKQQQQQSAFSSAAPPTKLSMLASPSLLVGSQYQQLLLDAQQRELAAQVQAMQARVRENEQMIMMQQQHRQQQQLLSSAFPSLLPLSSQLASPLANSVRSLVPPLDSASSTASSSFSHALLQHQLLAAYQQQQQQQPQHPAALPLGPSPSLSSPLSTGAAGSTGSAFTSPSSASAGALSNNAAGLLSPQPSNHTALNATAASTANHAATASFKPQLPQTFTPLTLPLQAS